MTCPPPRPGEYARFVLVFVFMCAAVFVLGESLIVIKIVAWLVIVAK